MANGLMLYISTAADFISISFQVPIESVYGHRCLLVHGNFNGFEKKVFGVKIDLLLQPTMISGRVTNKPLTMLAGMYNRQVLLSITKSFC